MKGFHHYCLLTCLSGRSLGWGRAVPNLALGFGGEEERLRVVVSSPGAVSANGWLRAPENQQRVAGQAAC